MKGNYTTWRKVLDESFILTLRSREPSEKGDHFIVFFGLWIHNRWGIIPSMLDELWTTGVIKSGVRSMKQLGDLLTQKGQDSQKEVVYALLIDGPYKWFEAWVLKEEKTKGWKMLEYLYDEGVNVFHGQEESVYTEFSKTDHNSKPRDMYEGARKELEEAKKENAQLKRDEGGWLRWRL
ncbi:unnamed protein product [Vitrella brassicaformis CCMP3155]|uniref:Uncharacterized protein n=1 Tax=Vitrella brassicaformis (strain CCMP3155) TaxID=1169540 RepID=A0A0G4GPU6_VITBC|nr:unnamed protein product [Vitrella brassicaformis CCMP3155]|eukprot:CEM32393.1 unnamed protein product [Vitrella brassicaformis CCMP3155]